MSKPAEKCQGEHFCMRVCASVCKCVMHASVAICEIKCACVCMCLRATGCMCACMSMSVYIPVSQSVSGCACVRPEGSSFLQQCEKPLSAARCRGNIP